MRTQSQAPSPPVGRSCRVQVADPVMLHDWRNVSFLHWPLPPELVQQRLPEGLVVDTFEGVSWVGVVLFVLSVWTAGGQVGARFGETNVRTYVRGPDGRAGVWFWSLDAARTDAVVTARLSHGLAYRRAAVAVDVKEGVARYRTTRLWPHRAASLRTDVRIGAQIDPGVVSPLERFLTDRHRLYSVRRGRLFGADAQHESWPLHRAELLDLEQDLVQAAGLPVPDRPSLVHYSPGVAVGVGRLTPVSDHQEGLCHERR